MKLNSNKGKNKTFVILSHNFFSDTDLETTKESIPMIKRLILLGNYLRKYTIKSTAGNLESEPTKSYEEAHKISSETTGSLSKKARGFLRPGTYLDKLGVLFRSPK